MEDYFKKGKIDNPLNIKRVGGDIPTTKSSAKNVILLLGTSTMLALTLNKVWAFLLSYLKYPALTAIVMVVTYTILILKVVSVSVLEEKKQKKAFKDLLDNRFSDLSVYWEIQDIKQTQIMGKDIAYIDYIDGTRRALLRCVPGSILNLDEDTPKYHYISIEKVLNYIDDLGYNHDLHVVEEPVTDDKALKYYYDNLRNYSDPDFIDIFTKQLDTIAEVSEIRSAIHVVYISISAGGKHKHNMLRNLTALPEIMGSNHIFKDVSLVESKAKIDRWISYTNSVSMFDREELIMNKYKDTFNLSMTSVLGAFQTTGELIKQFNKDFDIKRIVRKRSINTQQKADEPKTSKPKVVNNTLAVAKAKPMSEINLPHLDDDSKYKDFLELMYSNDKVKLGE